MRIRILAALAFMLLFSACKKDGDKARIIVNIKSSQDKKSNVYISLLSDERKIYVSKDSLSAISDANGQLTFKVAPNKTYYLYHYISDDQIIDSTFASFIRVGVFESQQQINSSPPQTPAGIVGGYRYQDINGDGKIDRYDAVLTVTAPSAGYSLTIDYPLVAR